MMWSGATTLVSLQHTMLLSCTPQWSRVLSSVISPTITPLNQNSRCRKIHFHQTFTIRSEYLSNLKRDCVFVCECVCVYVYMQVTLTLCLCACLMCIHVVNESSSTTVLQYSAYNTENFTVTQQINLMVVLKIYNHPQLQKQTAWVLFPLLSAR